MLPNALAAAARALAIAEKRPVLVSYTERAPALDPLAILAEFASSWPVLSDLADHAMAGMMYWTRPDEGFSLAGIGAAAAIAAEGKDRFASVDQLWSDLINGSLTNGAGKETGIGPTLMGGFSFDDEGPKSHAWRDFPSAHFVVPRFLITEKNGECWITVSWMTDVDGEPDLDVEQAFSLREKIVESAESSLDEVELMDEDDRSGFSESVPNASWPDIVAKAISEIRSGGMQKVVLARSVEITTASAIDPFELLRHLRSTHRSSFVFGCWLGHALFAGASPERLVRLDGRRVRASSLAGTIRRGATPAEDAELAEALISSAKDQAEHAAVRNALRGRLAEVCDDVVAADAPALLTLPHVHHLHTAVTGKLKSDNSLIDLVGRLHPTPAVGGTPRERALEFIRENEQLDRGWYAAPIGWVGRDAGEFAVALRSGVISDHGHEATLFAGCGIVADSDPDLELAESALKLRPMQAAIGVASPCRIDGHQWLPVRANF